MKILDQTYINGRFEQTRGSELFSLYNPATNEEIGRVKLGNEEDAARAIRAAKAAFPAFSRTTKEERIAMLGRLYRAMEARKEEHIALMKLEYGAPDLVARASSERAVQAFQDVITLLQNFSFDRRISRSELQLMPIGVVALITPWNANTSFLATKFAYALAAGCTTVIKPSEMSALQTQLFLECVHAAELPPGLLNLVNGRGDVVGAAFTASPDVSKVSFTGSTAVGKAIAIKAGETLKRFTLELGGKSAHILLDDADLGTAIPRALTLAFMNSGQACIAGTRFLVPRKLLPEVEARLGRAVAGMKVGSGGVDIGPLVSRKQWERVQSYIRAGLDEGAKLLAGGLGHPVGLERGNFVKPTIFTNVSNEMRIAREEIFGPVLSVIAYDSIEEAVRMANDTTYGLAGYVSGSDLARAKEVGRQLEAGRVAINDFDHDSGAPFGGHKQSGIGYEYGEYGLEEYLLVKTLL